MEIRKADYVHLHCHSTYSAYDGFASLVAMIRKSKAHGQKALALTDHGTMAGVIKFVQTCREEGIKPIVGMEAYLSRDHKARSVQEQPTKAKGNHHLCLFAKNYKGYQNLCTLAHRAELNGFYRKPRIDLQMLSEFGEGLLCSSACLSSIVNWNLQHDRYDKAKKAATVLKDIFRDDFYLEGQFHGLDSQAKILPDIQRLSRELEIKVVVTNDAHYVEQADAEMHELTVCMSQKRTLRDPSRKPFPYKEFYLKSTEEMWKIFGTVPQYMMNTVEVAEKTDLTELRFGGMTLPLFVSPTEFATPFDHLSHLAWKGLAKRGKSKNEEYVARLNLELSDIKLVLDTKNYDFPTYFLIVEDIINRARTRKPPIPIDIRGSGCGSLLLYALYISKVDPIKYGLSWNRFLGFDSLFFFTDDDFGLKPVACK